MRSDDGVSPYSLPDEHSAQRSLTVELHDTDPTS
jgi:hypothetical protein